MKNRLNVILLPNAVNVRISANSTDKETIIAFESDLWPGRECIYIVPEQWELETVNNRHVTLINYNEIITENAREN